MTATTPAPTTRTGRAARSTSHEASRPLSPAAERALARRRRRQGSAPDGLLATGRPVAATLARVPFVIALIAVLAGGVGGVLYLNTKIDESGMRTEQAKSTAADLRLQIEALDRTIAGLNATPHLADEARALGLVPAGDTAMIVITEKNGKLRSKIVGDPTPVPAARSGAGR